MATWADVERVLAGLPGVRDDDGAWRVAGKVVARRALLLRTDDEDEQRRLHGDPIAIWTGYEDRTALVQEDPATFFFTPHWETTPATLAWLARIDRAHLSELLTEAWERRAPKRLVREHKGTR